MPIEPTAKDVQHWLTLALADTADRPVPELVVEGPVYEGSHSRIFKGCGGALPGQVAIKLCRDPRAGTPALAYAEMQYGALERVTAASARNGGPLVPTPIALIRDRGIIISEWVEGPTIGSLCRNWHCPTPLVTMAVGRGGRWLRRFHASHSLEPGIVDTQAILAGTEAAIAAGGPHLAEIPAIRHANAVLRLTLTGVATLPVPRSWTYGDCKPDNLIDAPARMVGLDIGANFENVVVLDLAHFLNHLELDFFHPGSIRRVFGKRRLVREFCAEYDPTASVPALPLEWVRLAMLLRLYAVRARVRTGTRWRYVNWCFHRLIRQRIRALEQQAGPFM